MSFIFNYNSEDLSIQGNLPKEDHYMTREKLHSGKAKTIYKTDNPDILIAEFRNSLTAFNGEKKRGDGEKRLLQCSYLKKAI